MLFNPTDKSNSIIADIDFLLFGSGDTFNTDYSLADRTRNINVAWDDAVAELFKADPNWTWDDTTNTTFPIATTDIVASQDHYSILDSSLVVHRVRMKDINGKWKTLTPRLRREFNDSELASTGSPEKYYKLGGAIFPVPIPTYSSTGGLELEFQRGANYFSTTDINVSPGFDPQYHQFLSVTASLRYAMGNGMREKVSFLSNEKERIRTAMREHYQMRSPDERPQIRLKRRSANQYGL